MKLKMLNSMMRVLLSSSGSDRTKMNPKSILTMVSRSRSKLLQTLESDVMEHKQQIQEISNNLKDETREKLAINSKLRAIETE